MTIRVIVVEDHLLALEAMSVELSKHPDIEIVTTASGDVSTANLLQLIHDNEPHLVILDLSMKVSNLNPFATIPSLQKNCPEVDVLVLIRREDGILVRWLISCKVKGCLFNDDEQTLSLGAVVRKISEGKIAYSQEILERYFQLFELALTPRELDVLGLAGEGLSNSGIAKRLSISSVTIRNHLSNIYAKLGIPQDAGLNVRVCAINIARRLGLARTDVLPRTEQYPGH
jgi:DNA-binding NarL/FixJ family response regulator